MHTIRNVTILLVAALATAGCSGEGRVRPPGSDLTVLNAAPSFRSLDFLRARRVEATLDFRGSSVHRFDSGPYTFSVETIFPGDNEATVEASFELDLDADSQHLIVLAESAGTVMPIVYARPNFSPNADDVEILVVHAAETVAAVDVYLEPPDTDLAAATPRGSVAFLDDLSPNTIAAGDYVLSLTASGNPADVLFTSSTLTLGAGVSLPFVIVDGADEGLAPLFVMALGASGTPLIDTGIQTAFRLINGALDRNPRDVYLNDDFSAPAIAGTEFGTVSAYALAAVDETKITVTPLGNPSVIELEQTYTPSAGSLNNILLSGASGDLAASIFSRGMRRITGQALVQFWNAVDNHDSVGIFVREPGSDVTGGSPDLFAVSPGITDRIAFPPGEYELTITDASSNTVISTPALIALTAEGIYTVLFVDNPDGTTADFVFLDDFN